MRKISLKSVFEKAQQRSTGLRLMVAALSLGMVVTVFTTLVLIGNDYQQSVLQLQSDLADVVKSARPRIIEILDHNDSSALGAELRALYQGRLVTFAEVVTPQGKAFTVGDRPIGDEKFISEKILLNVHTSDSGQPAPLVGSLRLDVSLEPLRAHRLSQLVTTLLLETLGMLIAVFCFVGLYHQLIARHLRTIADYARNFNFAALPAPLDLKRRGRHRDELHVLAAAINEMRRNLQREKEERERVERDLFLEKELAEVTLYSITDAILTADATLCVRMVNDAAEKLTGWAQNQALSRPLMDVLCYNNETTRGGMQEQLQTVLVNGEPFSDKFNIQGRHGREHIVEMEVAPIRDEAHQVVGVVVVLHDVTQAAMLTEQLAYQATHDDQTQLMNRRGFLAELEKAYQSVFHDEQHVLLLLDVDQFKLVNDTCGHQAGDALLRQVATALACEVPKEGTLARTGGDEFGLLLWNGNPAEAERVAGAMLSVMAGYRFIWQEKSMTLTVSIGLTMVDQTLSNAEEALSRADLACYAAKDSGRNRYCWYRADEEDLLRQQNALHILADMQQAIAEKRLALFAQRILPLQGQNEPLHLEVLLRLYDSQGNIVSPDAFIPVAERHDLMASIDYWVLEQTVIYLARLREAGHELPILAVNLSAKSLNWPTLVFITDLLAKYQIAAENICFEITESSAIVNRKESEFFIATLKQKGATFALDDFGSGFSTFSYLRQLPVDYLKIDGSLVKEISHDKVSRQMVAAVNQIAHTLGMRTIAEYVSEEGMVPMLTAIGVDYIQGYLIGKAVPLDSQIPLHILTMTLDELMPSQLVTPEK